MIVELQDRLRELDRLLEPHPHVHRMLRTPATSDSIDAVAATLGVELQESVATLYAWHDGSVTPEPGQWPLDLFPMYWQFMPLQVVLKEAEWPLAWCREQGKLGFPIAVEATGQFLVAAEGEKDALWRVSSDHLVPAWPDGTLLGLVTATVAALRGQSREYAAEFAPDRMSWIALPGGVER
jgi:hypothetical protein